MADTLSEQQLSQLLDELKRLPPRKGYSPTFLQMAGFPDWENVWSNILAFYFQSTNGHELGNVVFREFMTLIGIDVSPEVVVKARREEIVEGGKRLDLVLETPDMVVGIENKVNHELNNDLCAYRRHLDELAFGRDVHAFVLSLHAISAGQDCAADWHFVTYDHFSAKLQRIDFGPAQISNKYVMFLDDFVTSIVKPNRGGSMDAQRLEFFKQYRAETETLLKEVIVLKEDMRRKVETLREAILASQVPVKNGLWRSDEWLQDMISNRVDIAPDLVLVVDVVIAATGWEILFHNERRDQSKAERWIRQQGILLPYHTRQNPWRARIDDPAAPGYDAGIDQVSEWVIEYLVKVLPK
jgi:hypothetical protein